MATFFGEISPLSSRAVDDEEIEDQLLYNLTIEPESQDNYDCKLLIFAVGDLATAFVKCYLTPGNASHLFDIKCSSDKDPLESIMYTGVLAHNSKVLKAAGLYSVNQDVIVCEIGSPLPEEIQMDLCDLILTKINCSESLVLTSRHIATYKTGESLPEAPFLKYIATSKFVANRYNSLPRLPAPNFVTDFPAALISEFEIKKRPAVCVVNYVDNNSIDSLYIQAFERIFSEGLFEKLSGLNDAKVKLGKYIKAIEATRNSLYT